MLGRIGVCWLVISVAIGAAACAGPSPTAPVFPSGQTRAQLELDASDNGRTIGLSVGETFSVTLGFRGAAREWRFSQRPDSSIVVVSSSGVAGTSQVWVFQATGPGTTNLAIVNATTSADFRLNVSVT
jgi:hypothetical protein